MHAAWLVGTEHLNAEHAGEICVFEIDAAAIGPTSRARAGIKAHGDPRLLTDMAEVEILFDASRPHTWTAIWGRARPSSAAKASPSDTSSSPSTTRSS